MRTHRSHLWGSRSCNIVLYKTDNRLGSVGSGHGFPVDCLASRELGELQRFVVAGDAIRSSRMRFHTNGRDAFEESRGRNRRGESGRMRGESRETYFMRVYHFAGERERERESGATNVYLFKPFSHTETCRGRKYGFILYGVVFMCVCVCVFARCNSSIRCVRARVSWVPASGRQRVVSREWQRPDQSQIKNNVSHWPRSREHMMRRINQRRSDICAYIHV